MLINFLKIRIENFLSIGEADIDLNRQGYTLVRGVNNNPTDLAKSNGSGKSSIWEAISWCLTGETIRGIRTDISNIYSNDGAYVELDFECDDKLYKIIRTKDNKKYKTSLKIFINGEDKSGKGIRDSEKLLSQYLPDLTSSLIGSVIILGQGLPQRFSNNTPSGRKEVLEKLSKSDFMIEDLKERLNSRKQYVSTEAGNIHDSVVADTSKLSYIKSRKEMSEKELSNIGTTDDFEEKIKEYRKLMDDSTRYVESATAEIDALEKEAESLRNSYTEMATEKNSKILEINSVYDEKKMKSYKKLLKTTSDIDSTRKEILKLDSVQDVCPTCGQKLANVHKIDTSGLKKDLEELNKKKLLENQRYNDLVSSIDKKKLEVDSMFNGKMQEIVTLGKEKTTKISTLKRRMEEARASREIAVKNIHNYETKLSNFNSEKLRLEGVISECNSEIASISEKIMYNSSIGDKLKQRLEVLNKFGTSINRDFRGYLLLNTIDYINSRAKYYSLNIFETDKIDFCLDGNNIDISYDGKHYENLSGGEKQKVDLIVQFSIKDMLCNFLNFSCNILVIDEIFDNLDSIGCQKVVDLISTKLQDIKAVYIVTHRSDLDIPVDYEMVVEKNEDRVSCVRNGLI